MCGKNVKTRLIRKIYKESEVRRNVIDRLSAYIRTNRYFIGRLGRIEIFGEGGKIFLKSLGICPVKSRNGKL